VTHPGGFVVKGQEVLVINELNRFGKYINLRYKGINEIWNGVTL